MWRGLPSLFSVCFSSSCTVDNAGVSQGEPKRQQDKGFKAAKSYHMDTNPISHKAAPPLLDSNVSNP